jgi:hypothetical protein
MTSPQAVADKVVKAIGVDGVEFKINSLISKLLAPADNAGSSTITSLITAVIALLFLAAIVYLVLGLIQSIRGTRGGVETVAQVVIGLVFAVAAFQILA